MVDRIVGRLAPAPWRKGDDLPEVGTLTLVSGANCDVESDQHRSYGWRRVVGYGEGDRFVCLQTEGCWPTVERTENCWFAEIKQPRKLAVAVADIASEMEAACPGYIGPDAEYSVDASRVWAWAQALKATHPQPVTPAGGKVAAFRRQYPEGGHSAWYDAKIESEMLDAFLGSGEVEVAYTHPPVADAALVRDAQRYRMLRDKGAGWLHVYQGTNACSLLPEELDTVLDRALSQKDEK